MKLKSNHELEVTRQKILELERLFAATSTDATQNKYSRELTLRSLRRVINRLKEEAAIYEAHKHAKVAKN